MHELELLLLCQELTSGLTCGSEVKLRIIVNPASIFKQFQLTIPLLRPQEFAQGDPTRSKERAGSDIHNERITRQQQLEWRRSTHIRQRSARPFRFPERDHRRTRHRQIEFWSRLQRCVKTPLARGFARKSSKPNSKK